MMGWWRQIALCDGATGIMAAQNCGAVEDYRIAARRMRAHGLQHSPKVLHCATDRAPPYAGWDTLRDQRSWLVTKEPSAAVTGLELLT